LGWGPFEKDVRMRHVGGYIQEGVTQWDHSTPEEGEILAWAWEFKF